VLGSQDGLWEWDLENNSIYWSPRFKGMLGYEDGELSVGPGDWEARLHPDDRDHALAVLRAYVEGRSPHFQLLHRCRRKDGSYGWFRCRSAALRDAAGKPCRIAGSVEDITERKAAEEALRESEERYRSVIAAMQDGIVLLDAAGKICACNASA